MQIINFQFLGAYCVTFSGEKTIAQITEPVNTESSNQRYVTIELENNVVIDSQQITELFCKELQADAFIRSIVTETMQEYKTIDTAELDLNKNEPSKTILIGCLETYDMLGVVNNAIRSLSPELTKFNTRTMQVTKLKSAYKTIQSAYRAYNASSDRATALNLKQQITKLEKLVALDYNTPIEILINLDWEVCFIELLQNDALCTHLQNKDFCEAIEEYKNKSSLDKKFALQKSYQADRKVQSIFTSLK